MNLPDKPVRALGALCAALALVPILLAAIPPLLDYPSHIARIFIIHDLLFHGRFAEMYALHPAILPNLGMDVVLLGAMAAGIDIEIAGRLLLAVLVLGLGSSVMLVHRRLFGRWSIFPLLALAFIYNKILMLGFINYLLGVSIALFGFAFWLHARDGGAPVRSALILIGWSVAAFFCHLMAVLLLLGLIGGHEAAWSLHDLARRGIASAVRHAGRTAAALLPSTAAAAGLYMMTPFSEQARSTKLEWGLADISLLFMHRVNALLHAADSYDPTLNYVVVGGLVLVLLGCLLAGHLRIAWSMLPALATIALANFVVPYYWNGASFIADRIPILLVLLGIAALDIDPRPRRYAGLCLAVLILALVGARSISAGIVWQAADRNYNEMRAALDRLPEGTSIYGSTIYDDSFQTTLRQPWSHFPAIGVLRKRIFVAGVFADASQNILVRRRPYDALALLLPSVLRVDGVSKPPFENDVFAPERLTRFDYVLIANPRLYPGGIPSGLVPLQTAGEATLFAISHTTH